MSRKTPRKKRPPADWRTLNDEQLLDMRVRDLGLQIAGSPLEACVQRLYDELGARGLVFRPTCYLADEWFCPDRVPTIGIPFCLAHPRLKAIEQRMMFEVEGGREKECMRLLRHETGHAINYAYRLYRRTRWRELFGSFTTPYRDSYPFQPYSRRYVIHLADSYAQAHPDEDFAETFAVWLTPGSDWRERYDGWPVMAKLAYVDRLMQRIGPTPPVVTARETPFSAARMTSTLSAFYERRKRVLGDDFPGYYDASLERMFSTKPGPEKLPAARFIRRNRRLVIDRVAVWTGRRKYDLHQLLTKLARRCDALHLYVNQPEPDRSVDLAAFVSAVIGKLHRVDWEHKR